jgi:hypothetical protein
VTEIYSVSQYSVRLDRMTGVQSPAEAKGFSSSLCVQTSSEIHQASYPMGNGGHIHGGKEQLGCDADHSPTSSAKGKNEYKL